jgi:glycosyltransferase involved in cell wall biosynthesis
VIRNRLYYALKPLIPRRVQIVLRRQLVLRKKSLCKDVWPIDEQAGTPPAGWSGWPEGKKFALVLTHDVDTEKGHRNCKHLAELEKEMGFRSSFNFVAKRYDVSPTLRHFLVSEGFEVGLHGLYHDGKYYQSRKIFRERAVEMNNYLAAWGAVGFRSPAMHHNLDWIHELNIDYDASTFDTDPFEPQPDGMGTIFPFFVNDITNRKGYVELPYTLPQDFTLFSLMREKNIDIWKEKVDWIAEKGGMALINVHPDNMNFSASKPGSEDYPAEYYREFLAYIKDKYKGQYWHVLPKEIAAFWSQNNPSVQSTRRCSKSGKRACMLAYTFYESDNRVRRYAESLVQQGYHVDAVALRKEDQPHEGSLNGVTIYRIQKRVRDEKNKLSYLYRLLKFLINSAFFLSQQHIKKRYDLIHVHSVPDFEVFATFLAKMTGARIILDIHDIVPEFYASKFQVSSDSLVFKALALIEKTSIAFSDHVIIANHIWEKTLTARSVKKDKCTTMLNYPDLSIFYRRPRTRKDDKFIIIYPGTINWHQGIDISVRAFARLKDDAPDAEFHIYGDGSMLPVIRQLISDLDLRDRVLLKGTLPSELIAEVMANADLGVVPKRNDPFGGDAFSTKIFEFMALGVPVIASKTRIDSYYFNESLVKFFQPEDEQSLADAMLTMIRNHNLRKKLASNALVYVAKYSWDINRQDYFNLVDRLVKGKS